MGPDLTRRAFRVQYHIGFRSQAATWPVHPLALIAQALLSSLPANALIADFGCGDAALARTLCPSTSPAAATLPPMPSLKVPAKVVAQKQLKVASFDLLSQSSFVVEAECSSVPLPGGTAGGEIVDAVVCCLSLMGTDWIRMVREAKRVLRDGCVPPRLHLRMSVCIMLTQVRDRSGVLKIAEVTSRFTSVDEFVKLVNALGFTLSHKVRPLFYSSRASSPHQPADLCARGRTIRTRTSSCSTLRRRAVPTRSRTPTRRESARARLRRCSTRASTSGGRVDEGACTLQRLGTRRWQVHRLVLASTSLSTRSCLPQGGLSLSAFVRARCVARKRRLREERDQSDPGRENCRGPSDPRRRQRGDPRRRGEDAPRGSRGGWVDSSHAPPSSPSCLLPP